MNDIDKLIQSTEQAIIEAQDCILGIINISEGTEIDLDAKFTYELLDYILCNFAQLCNAIEVKPGRKINLEEAIRRAEGLE